MADANVSECAPLCGVLLERDSGLVPAEATSLKQRTHWCTVDSCGDSV